MFGMYWMELVGECFGVGCAATSSTVQFKWIFALFCCVIGVWGGGGYSIETMSLNIVISSTDVSGTFLYHIFFFVPTLRRLSLTCLLSRVSVVDIIAEFLFQSLFSASR